MSIAKNLALNMQELNELLALFVSIGCGNEFGIT